MPIRSQGTYYFARVIKHGLLNNEKIKDAIIHPQPIESHNSGWTFLDAYPMVGESDNLRYVYGQLCKFNPAEEVPVIDKEAGTAGSQTVPNSITAASPFIYLPDYSGLMFLRISRHIEPSAFMNRFGELIGNKYENYFHLCKVEPITDLRSFAKKLSKLTNITEIKASVSPPNPLWGPLWKPLKDYLVKRNTGRMQIKEEGTGGTSVDSMLPTLVKQVAEGETANVNSRFGKQLGENIDLGDAAILMAADGYGNGQVKGKLNGEVKIIRTSETIRNVQFKKGAESLELFEKAERVLQKINFDRHLRHD